MSGNLTRLRESTDFRVIDPSKPIRINLDNKDPLGQADPISLPALFNRTVENFPNHAALMHKDLLTKEWKCITYREYKERVEKMTKVFIKLGLERYGTVAVIAFNSVEWFVAELAAIHAGGLIAGIYTTNSVDACQYVLESSRANIVVVDDIQQMEKIHAIKDKLPHLKVVVQTLAPYPSYMKKSDGYWRWSELEQLDTDDVEEEYRKRSSDIVANEGCCLVYTSGTTGKPKGVMLSHDNLTWDASTVVARFNDISHIEMGKEVIISYLPLSHVAAQMINIITITVAGTIYFADKNALKGSLVKTLLEARPTRFVGVPRVYEKIQEKLSTAESQSGTFMRIIGSWARSVALKHYIECMSGRSSNSIQLTIANNLILSQVRKALGFERCKMFVTAAAPMLTETKKFFMSLGMPINDSLGLSESAGHSLGTLNSTAFDTVGKALQGTETMIANPDSKGHGEICMRGRHVFMGYLGDHEKTIEAIDDDGWLHSGDIGHVDEHGQIFVTGRLKELIITAGGENVPPVHAEEIVLAECSALSNAILIGDKRKYLTILVTLKTEMNKDGTPSDELAPDTLEWLQTLELSYTKLSEILAAGPDEKVMQAIQEAITRANKSSIWNAHNIQKFDILPRDFTHATGELGPTLKLKRNVVAEMYKEVIENLYK